MDLQGKSIGRSAPGRDAGRQVVTVRSPAPYEGVGNALRSTFAPTRETLPADMMVLLDRLDRH
ncbi:hypothetical protein [Sphingobium amiense]|uniref:hypothetical protein n=1 Tax=Sphingobium amiense TaxID=135719 RepID=UPI00083126BE|nr:hypothetical protein [Sphingobium amiense]